MSVTHNPSFEQLQQWLAQGNKMPAQIVQLQQLISQIQQQLASLNALQASLNAQLAQLEQVKDPTPEQQQQMANLKAQLQSNQSQINSSNAQLATDQSQLASSQSSLKNFLASSQMTSNAMASTGKQLKTTTQNLNATESKAASQQDLVEQAEQNRQNALQSIQDYAQLAIMSGSDAITQMDRIAKDEKQIADDKAKEEELKDRIIEDSIKAAACAAASWFTFGASAAAAAYYTADAIEAGIELNNTKDDEAKATSDLHDAQAKLKADLDALSQANVGQLKGMIDQLFDMIQKIFTLMTSGECSVQTASQALAEVLSFLQMITTKVHQMRSDDQQWMSRATADSYDVATHQSQVDFEALSTLMEYADFMKTVMTVAQVAADVASVAVAVASGGTLAPIMAMLMVALTASGAFNKATEALADAMSKNGATWAKVLADVIVTVLSVVLTFSLSAAASRLTSVAAAEVSVAAAEVEAEVGSVVARMASAAEAEVGQVGNAAANATKSTMQKVGEFLKDLVKAMASKQGLGIGVMYFGANNGICDLASFLFAVFKGEAGASQKDLEKDKTFQIMQIIMSVVQAIVMMAAAKYAFTGQEGQKSLLETIFGKIDKLEQFLTFTSRLQAVANGAMVTADAGLVSNSVMQGHLTEMSGEAEARLVVNKTLQQILKLYESKEIENFAAMIQQQVQSMQTTLRKNAEAEMEAARLLLETAV